MPLTKEESLANFDAQYKPKGNAYISTVESQITRMADEIKWHTDRQIIAELWDTALQKE